MNRPDNAPLPAEAADETASIVRLYAVTDGRTRPRHTLSLHTVLGPGHRTPRPGLAEESAQIIALCRQRRRPLAELAGTVGLHVAAARVLASDLIDAGALTVPVPDVASGQGPDVQMLHAVAAALRLKFPDAAAKAG
ncbi:hypothetical protein B6E66_13500 [Streptomyces maremycinicus]|nr:hypothetical protein B6E66_13500 [Streptomyces sp. B9173]